MRVTSLARPGDTPSEQVDRLEQLLPLAAAGVHGWCARLPLALRAVRALSPGTRAGWEEAALGDLPAGPSFPTELPLARTRGHLEEFAAVVERAAPGED